MPDQIPDEILCEIESLGGLKGLSERMPNRKKIERVAKHYEILSEPIRLQVLLALSQGKLCVCVLKKITSCPDTRLSYHLSFLKRHVLIASEREKSFLNYFLTEKGKVIIQDILHTIESHNG
jgi:ArsR family transcriptional regulator